MSVRDNMRKAMYDRLLTQLPQVYPTADPLPVFLENQKFKQPPDSEFIFVWFRYSSSKRASIGTERRFNRHVGFLMIDVLVPEKTGTSVMWKLTDAVASIFEGQNVCLEDTSYVTLEVPQTFSQGAAVDGLYYTRLMIPFKIDAVPV